MPPHIAASWPFSAPGLAAGNRRVEREHAARFGVPRRSAGRSPARRWCDRQTAHPAPSRRERRRRRTPLAPRSSSLPTQVITTSWPRAASRGEWTAATSSPSAACLLDPRVRAGGGAVVDGDLVPGPGEVPGHRCAHHAKAEEGDALALVHRGAPAAFAWAKQSSGGRLFPSGRLFG